MMKRDECLKVLARHVTDADIVLPVYSAAFDWIDIRPHPLNYVSHGAMGLASSHALGLALGRPDRRIIVLDGDGSLLMNLGSLVTIAAAAPPNLYHFVCQNGTYEANGGDRKSTRLNSSHANISYAVFCLKKKKQRASTTGANCEKLASCKVIAACTIWNRGLVAG